MLVVSLLLFTIVCILLIERSAVQRSVDHLPLRIHVNGTRGKSSVTEYIAAGLYHAQPEVMAKITGIIPTIIHNGEKRTIARAGGARVQEQFNMIRLAAKKKVNSLVLECMSISPELQRLESRYFQPHIYVISNIRDDHREEMGNNIEEQAGSICNAIPENCTVITNEIRFLDKIKETASLKNSLVISPKELHPDFLIGLPFGVFPENVQLALAVCGAAGVNDQVAKEGIMKCLSNFQSPLSMVTHDSKEITFLNAFAVNDVDSTDRFIHHWQTNTGKKENISVILNTRTDRPIRTDLFAGWIAQNSSTINTVIVTGNHVNRAKYFMLQAGIDKQKIVVWRKKQIANLKASLFNAVSDQSFVVGIGNIQGVGFKVISEMR
ncbi:MAG: poly-gamma-glutamate synthase PgsB [Prolixibacteraceae bacterium]